jgi:hypothetical protein
MVAASVAASSPDAAELIAARFFHALSSAVLVASRAFIRDLYNRERVSAMISLVTSVMMIRECYRPAALSGPHSAGARSSTSSPQRQRLRWHRACTAGDPPPRRGGASAADVGKREPRLRRLAVAPGAGVSNHFHVRQRLLASWWL